LEQVRPVAERDVGAIKMNGPGRPLAGQAQSAPGADILLRAARDRRGPLAVNPAAGALRAVYAVDLPEGEPRERVVLVHDEHQAGRRALRIIIGTGGELDLERRIAELGLEGLETVAPLPVAHQADVRRAGHQAGEGLRGVDEVGVQPDLAVVAAEGVGPFADKRLERRAVDTQDAGDALRR